MTDLTARGRQKSLPLSLGSWTKCRIEVTKRTTICPTSGNLPKRRAWLGLDHFQPSPEPQASGAQQKGAMPAITFLHAPDPAMLTIATATGPHHVRSSS